LKKKLFLAFLVILQFARAHAQVIEGIVIDAKTNEKLHYVNVGLIGKAAGTVTDSAGHFKLTLNNNGRDSLRISMIGYIPKTFLVKDYSGNKTILLSPDNRQLKEVKVYSRQFKQSILGNTTQSKTTSVGFTSSELGNEIGAIIKIKRAPTHLKQFNASMANPANDSVKLRLNFYSVKNGKPDTILQQQNIFVMIKKGDDKIAIDLEPYHIYVEDKFFVSLEWIENKSGQGIMFSASLLRGNIVARETSQANWEKIGIAGIGFNVLASY
jgi:hypothetical protein